MTTVEKIKREIQERLSLQSCFKGEFAAGSRDALQGLLSFLSTLESEKPMQEELEKETTRKEFIEELNKYFFGCINSITIPECYKACEHFAKWGAENLKK